MSRAKNRTLDSSTRNFSRTIGRIVAAVAMLAAGIAFSAPPAAAAPQKIDNGVYQDGNSYWCNGKPAALRNTQYVIGTSGNDVLLAGPDTIQVLALGGNDTICSLGPGVVINAGSGDDDIFTSDERGAGATPRINVVIGGRGNDHIRGGDSWDDLSGGQGNDIIMAGGGIDYLWGGAGWDYLNGGDSNKDLCQDVNAATGEHHALCTRFGPNDPAYSPTMPMHWREITEHPPCPGAQAAQLSYGPIGWDEQASFVPEAGVIAVTHVIPGIGFNGCGYSYFR